MAAIVTIWIDILEGFIPKLACLLGCTDSSSTVGWMHRSNFEPVAKPIHECLARHLARILMAAQCTLYSQHQKGKYNVIADILSRWFFLSTAELTFFLQQNLFPQMPTNFQISPLPNEISSWITCTLEKLRETTACKTRPTRTETEHGNDGCHGYKQWASSETPSLMGLQYLKESGWSGALQSVYDDANTVIPDTRNHWLQAQLSRPCLTWVRPFNTTTSPTPDTTKTAHHTPTSRQSPALSKSQTPRKRHKKR